MNLSNHLRDNEQLFRLIVESIPGFVCSMTPAGEVEFVNRRFLEYTGKTLRKSEIGTLLYIPMILSW